MLAPQLIAAQGSRGRSQAYEILSTLHDLKWSIVALRMVWLTAGQAHGLASRCTMLPQKVCKLIVINENELRAQAAEGFTAGPCLLVAAENDNAVACGHTLLCR